MSNVANAQSTGLPSILDRLTLDDGTPLVYMHNDVPVTDSQRVSAFFEKRHDNVVRDIDKWLTVIPKEEHLLNFEEMFLQTEIGNGATREDRGFRMTEEGFALLGMSFTGEKATMFKIAYVKAFRLLKQHAAKLQKENEILLRAIIKDQRHILDTIKDDNTTVSDVVRLMERDQHRAGVMRANDAKVEIHEQFVNYAKQLLAQGVKNKALTESLQNAVRWHSQTWNDLFVKPGPVVSTHFYPNVKY